MVPVGLLQGQHREPLGLPCTGWPSTPSYSVCQGHCPPINHFKISLEVPTFNATDFWVLGLLVLIHTAFGKCLRKAGEWGSRKVAHNRKKILFYFWQQKLKSWIKEQGETIDSIFRVLEAWSLGLLHGGKKKKEQSQTEPVYLCIKRRRKSLTKNREKKYLDHRI